MLKMLFQFLSFIGIFNLISNQYYYDDGLIYSLKITNPVALQLSTGNVFLFSNEGFYILDTNFRKIYNYSIFSLNSTITGKRDYPSFTLFPPEEDGIVLCLTSNKEYYFNNGGELMSTYNIEILNETESCISNYVINSFKKYNSDYYYTITIYDNKNNGEIRIYYYKLNFQSRENILINNIIYNNEVEAFIESASITCQRTISSSKDKYLTCFYQYIHNGQNYITEITFEPDNNFEHIEPKIKFPIEYGETFFYYAASVSNEDYSRVYVCYTAEGQKGICFYFDINQRKFSQRHVFANECQGNFYFFNLNYFSQTKEFIFSCSPNNKFIYSIVKFNEEMNVIMPSNKGEYNILENCISSNGFLILYSLQSKGYLLFTNNICESNENEFKIKSYELTNYFNSSTILIPSSELNIDTLTTKVDMPNTLSTEVSKSTDISITNEISDSPTIKFDISDILSTEISKSTEINIISKISDSSYIKTDKSDIFSTEINYSSKITELIQTNEPLSTKISNEISDEITELAEIKKSTEIKESIELTEKSVEKSKNTHDIIDDKNCKDNYMIINSQGNCVCDNENGYYPIKINNNIHYNEFLIIFKSFLISKQKKTF